MTSNLHHVSLFTRDLERSLSLFVDLLGFRQLWRVGPMGGKGMAALFGLEHILAELVMLSGPDHTLLELINLLEPEAPDPAGPPALPAPVSLCLRVDDLDGLHQRLSNAGWRPFTPASQVPTPTGETMRIFCIRSEENVLLEFIETPEA